MNARKPVSTMESATDQPLSKRRDHDSAAPKRPPPDITITCCVEFGRLEEQTVLMVRSLRRFGGRFADVPVIAVIGRMGAPLRKETLEQFDQLGIRVVRSRASDNPATWLNYANKVAAVLTADSVAETSQIAWFDSDIFVLGEPTGILLRECDDFAARCHFMPPAVLEDDDTHVGYWTEICRLFGFGFADVPSVSGTEGFPRQKLSFNSGVFSWRRGSEFAALYSSGVSRLLKARIAQRSGEFFTVDQVVLTPLIVANRLRWRNLSPEDHLLVMGGLLNPQVSSQPSFEHVRLLHYSNSFAPEYRALMEQRLAREVPGFWAWLTEQQLNFGRAPLASRIVAAMLKAARGIQYRQFARSVTAVT